MNNKEYEIEILCIENVYLKRASDGKNLGIKVFTKDQKYTVTSDDYDNAKTIDDRGGDHCIGEFIDNKIKSKFFKKYFIYV